MKLHWHSDWRTALFTAVLLPLLAGLGYWQLQRADEKQQLAQSWLVRQQEAPENLQQMNADPDRWAYRRVLLRGEFLPGRDFLLDNQVRQGRYGVEVITPLRLQGSGALVLVNRGWIEADATRQTLPQPAIELGVVSYQGSVYVPPGASYTLGAISSSETWPRLAQALDVNAFAEMLQEPLAPYSVRLDEDPASDFVRAWPLLNTSPEKHRAYAVQWFSMALALALLFVWRSTNIGALWRHYRQHRS